MQGEKSRDESKTGNKRPTKTLFIINFDPIQTRTRDLERHFEPYGKIVSARIRKNFGFVQFETQEEATAALESTHARLVSLNHATLPLITKLESVTIILRHFSFLQQAT